MENNTIKLYGLSIVLLTLIFQLFTANLYASATINRVWVDHNQYEDGAEGMVIHVQFTVSGMKGKQGRVVAYFFYENGEPVKDKNNRYRDNSGDVAVGKGFSPSYDPARYNDFTIFMPYGELDLIGSYRLKFQVKIRSDDQRQSLARSDFHAFNLNWNPRNTTGSLVCEVACPIRGHSCSAFMVTLAGSSFHKLLSVPSSGIVTFTDVPAGTYSVYIGFPDSKAHDGPSPANPFRRSSMNVAITGGERSRVRFE